MLLEVAFWHYLQALVGRHRLGRLILAGLSEPDLAVAINWGNYHKPLTEQSNVVRTILAEIVLPSVV